MRGMGLQVRRSAGNRPESYEMQKERQPLNRSFCFYHRFFLFPCLNST